MTAIGWIQIALYCAIVVALVKPLGGFMTRVFAGERTFLSPILGPVERGLYRLAGVDARRRAALDDLRVRHAAVQPGGLRLLYALQRLQHVLPLNPQDMPAVPPDLAFNTAVSFVTNTNWQNYGGESTMSYLAQMAGLTVQNFVSAATGIALAVALVRGFARRSASGIGNFWADLTRATLYVLLPICVVYTLVPRLAGRAAEPFGLRRRDDARGRAADHRPRARSPRRRRSRCSAPTAAASSTPTRRIPTRTRRRLPTSSRWSRSSPSAPR